MQKSGNMTYNRFYFRIILSLVLVGIFSVGTAWFFMEAHQPATGAACLALVMLVLGNLVYYVNRTNRILGTFLVHLGENEASLSFEGKYIDRNFRGLRSGLEKVQQDFRQIRSEKEMQARYIGTILQHIDAGIIVYDGSGRVKLLNESVYNLLNIRNLQNIGDLEKAWPGLPDRLKSLEPQQQVTEKLPAGDHILHLSIRKNIIRHSGSEENILTIHDIRDELEQQELESWKRLIRVINHEIMNSITPVTTLTLAIRKKLTAKGKQKATGRVSAGDIGDVLASAGIIEERSKGLIEFIAKYRRLTRLPPLQIEQVDVEILFGSMSDLFREQFSRLGIVLETGIHQKSGVRSDLRLLEQVLINLIKNAAEAVQSVREPRIMLKTYMNEAMKPVISVGDNGCGMDDEQKQQAFVPFYTTKEEGSGIGLNLCRQIMKLHKGDIRIRSELGRGTEVILEF